MKTNPRILALMALMSASSLKAGIIEPKTLWDKTEIVACWYDSPSQLPETKLESEETAKKKFDFLPRVLKDKDKKKVKEVITRNFTPAQTGIHFVGWKPCSQTPNRDVIVMRAKSKVFLLDRPGFNGRATIGESGILARAEDGPIGFWDKEEKTPTIALYSTFMNPIGAGTIVHEFGHTAGLRHEHIHEDSYEDKNCHSMMVPLNFEKPEELETPHVSSVFVTEYDPTSIMNYCWLMTERSALNKSKNVILSDKDRATLKKYYQ